MDCEPLNNTLGDSQIPKDVKIALLKGLWGRIDNAEVTAAALDPYFKNYSSKCQEFLIDGGRHVYKRTHSDIVSIATLIVDGTSKEQICSIVEGNFANHSDGSEKSAETSINLCAALLIMADIEHDFGGTGRIMVDWYAGSLQRALKYQSKPQRGLNAEKPSIGKRFVA
ncbi:hypothetical protein HJFPF1_13083 [Paramyrothecium foliicola]|nr:hypothetical protein HJFPF1_13083 [Paramyrothecium foliicola]